MDITVKGLRHPHRYVLDAAQTHIYMLMKKVGGLCADGHGGPRGPSLLGHLGESLETGTGGDTVWLLLGWCWGAGWSITLFPPFIGPEPHWASSLGIWGMAGYHRQMLCVSLWAVTLRQWSGHPCMGGEDVAGIGLIYRGLGSSSHGAKHGALYRGPPTRQDLLLQSLVCPGSPWRCSRESNCVRLPPKADLSLYQGMVAVLAAPARSTYHGLGLGDRLVWERDKFTVRMIKPSGNSGSLSELLIKVNMVGSFRKLLKKRRGEV